MPRLWAMNEICAHDHATSQRPGASVPSATSKPEARGGQSREDLGNPRSLTDWLKTDDNR